MKQLDMIRFIKLFNHYPDDDVAKDDNNTTNNKPLGVYCAFGYHDAISVSVPEEIKDSYSICDNKSQSVTDHVDGTYTIEALSCLFSSTYAKKEESFWNLEDSLQYRFITVIRIGEDVQKEKIQKVIDDYNSKSDVMVYYSLEHCELLTVIRTDSYVAGMERVKEICGNFSTSKSFTIFAIPEEALKSKDNFNTENVDVLLKCSIKNYECAEQYFKELIKILQKHNDNFSFDNYDIFGEYDIIIIIKDIQLGEILPLYSMGEILTHSNKEYNEAFYNIETSFICRK